MLRLLIPNLFFNKTSLRVAHLSLSKFRSLRLALLNLSIGIIFFVSALTNLARACELPQKEGFRIFVSFSMPKQTIVNFDRAAQKIGAKLVIRGLKNNSFKDTFSYVKSLSDTGVIIDIDPKSFEEYNITQVPAFVINKDDKSDKLTGNVSIIHALKEFAGSGELKGEAKKYLKRLVDENH